MREPKYFAFQHYFTLTGRYLRLYRFDSASYCCSAAIDVRRSSCLPDLARFVAFITDPPSCSPSVWLGDGLTLLSYGAGESRWEWEIKAGPVVLEDRVKLFGRRTRCWGGRARPAGDELIKTSLSKCAGCIGISSVTKLEFYNISTSAVWPRFPSY